ncbi:MAG: hypothetical protein RLZZ440_2503 [Planctomycetota bacterium]
MACSRFASACLLLAILGYGIAPPAIGEVFTPGMAVSGVDYFGQPAFKIEHIRPDGGGSQLYVTLSSPAPQVQITPIDATPAWPTSWYQASYELPFDGPAVESMTPFANNWGDPESAITVDSLTTFYLASWAGNEFGAGQPIIGPDDYYLWGRFQVTNDGGVSSLALVESAITKVGIYVGTTVAVPEPSMLGLGWAAALVAWRWRGRSRPTARNPRTRVRGS